MSFDSSRSATASRAVSPTETLALRLSALTSRAKQDCHLFASPLGPFYVGGRNAWLPRFVFFGPLASDAAWRLALLSGFDARDHRLSHALVGLVERLTADAADGHGLDLTFFPQIDVAGVSEALANRDLAHAHWARSTAPEIALLERDARSRGYHGYIRVEAAAPGEEIITLRVREPAGLALSPDVELISSDDVAPFPVRFERGEAGCAPADGPLSIAEDLPVQPFELTLRIPAVWPEEIQHEAVSTILIRFLYRYRAFQAYGQHL
jgi:hypothetical protein